MNRKAILGVFACLSVIHLAACSSDSESSDSANLCEDYCTRIIRDCTGDAAQFKNGDKLICQKFCAQTSKGAQGDSSGNTVFCRSGQLSLAAETSDAKAKRAACISAGPYSDVCGNRCDSFCSYNALICSGANAAYPNKNSCADECNAIVKSGRDGFDKQFIDSDKDTLACRGYHLELATQDPRLHCPHTSKVSSTCTVAQ